MYVHKESRVVFLFNFALLSIRVYVQTRRNGLRSSRTRNETFRPAFFPLCSIHWRLITPPFELLIPDAICLPSLSFVLYCSVLIGDATTRRSLTEGCDVNRWESGFCREWDQSHWSFGSKWKVGTNSDTDIKEDRTLVKRCGDYEASFEFHSLTIDAKQRTNIRMESFVLASTLGTTSLGRLGLSDGTLTCRSISLTAVEQRKIASQSVPSETGLKYPRVSLKHYYLRGKSAW